jgi:hypothetical protein
MVVYKKAEMKINWETMKLILTECLNIKKAKAKTVPLHTTEALAWRGGIAPTHSRPRH